jgi:hypothetical protein
MPQLAISRGRRRQRRFLVLAAAILALAFAGPAAADRSTTTPTSWVWFYGATPATIQTQINAGYRLVNIQVESTSPTFTVAFVRNTGAYAKAWWWYYGLTSAQVSTALSTNTARLIDIAPYNTSGGLRFAAVMIRNTGADAKAWWWYYGLTASQVVSTATTNNARAIDAERYATTSGDRFATIQISYTGADAKSWYFYANVTPATISSTISTNGQRVIDLAPSGTAGRFDAVFEHAAGQYWWWYYGVDATTLTNLALQDGGRVFDVDTYLVSGQRRFTAAVLQNSPVSTHRVNEWMRSAVTNHGYWGVYLRRTGGGATVGAINENRKFEPASMMKVLYHLKALRTYQTNLPGLNANMTWNLGSSIPDDPATPDDERADGCPNGTLPTTNTIATVLSKMMSRSDNRATDAILNKFGGFSAMNALAAQIGMTNTITQHKLGCGSQELLHPNTLTLVDAGKLYEGAGNGTLLNAAAFTTFKSLMIHAAHGHISGMIAGRSAVHDTGGHLTGDALSSMAAAAGLTTAQRNDYLAHLEMIWKGGGYTLCSPTCVNDITLGGRIVIPYKALVSGTPHIFYNTYVIGDFTQNIPNQWDAVLAWDRGMDIVRPVLAAALPTWKL